MPFFLIILATIDDGAVIVEFTFDDGLPFGCLIVLPLQDMEGFIILHIVDQTLCSRQHQSAAITGSIIHVGENTAVVHQGRYILRLLVGVLSGGVSSRHIIPLVRSVESGRK